VVGDAAEGGEAGGAARESSGATAAARAERLVGAFGDAMSQIIDTAKAAGAYTRPISSSA
jgi:hypothetical protein